MSVAALMAELWRDYRTLAPHAEPIHELIGGGGEVPNDHVAFRGLNRPGFGIDAIAAPFVALGYREQGEYLFPDKKLFARHFETEDPNDPKLFVSELEVEKLGPAARSILDRLMETAVLPPDRPLARAGRPWPVAQSEYRTLLEESEYAAWLAAFGYVVNHFTVAVHRVPRWPSLETLNQALIDSGFALNGSGGLIKGSPEVGLEQSSTLAAPITVAFTDGPLEIPGVYYEFARRHPVNGALFSGFVTGSADRIFESTDVRR